MRLIPSEKGQGLVEYALILVLVALIVIVILALLGPAIGGVFSNIVNLI
jgi:pilus assembly protein Flp/PilA